MAETLESSGKHIEVVFVSSDRSEESFGKYLETMPWWAVPFGDSRMDQLKTIFGVDGKISSNKAGPLDRDII